MGHSVLIIGNGFDLNLGLRTSYKDYMSSSFFRNHLNLDNELFDYLANKTDVENWIDIEKELANFSRTKKDYGSFKHDYFLLCETLKDYLTSLDLTNINQASEAYEFLVNSFSENTTILNFNYTNSVHHILERASFPNELILQNVTHVHGSVIGENIIFGVDDKARINADDTFLYKSTSSNYSGRVVRAALRDFDDLKIFGHSLGESDHMYFKEPIFRLGGDLNFGEKLDKKMALYYYEDEGKYQLYKQLHKLTMSHVAGLKDNVLFNEFDTSLKEYLKQNLEHHTF